MLCYILKYVPYIKTKNCSNRKIYRGISKNKYSHIWYRFKKRIYDVYTLDVEKPYNYGYPMV